MRAARWGANCAALLCRGAMIRDGALRGAAMRGADMRGAEGAARGAGPACLPLLFCASASECAADSTMRMDATSAANLNMTQVPYAAQGNNAQPYCRLHECLARRMFSRR